MNGSALISMQPFVWICLCTAVCFFVLTRVEFGAGVWVNVDGLQFRFLTVDAQPVCFALRQFRDGGFVASCMIGISTYTADCKRALKMLFVEHSRLYT